MTLKRMPNGEYLDIPDDATPAELATLATKFAGSKRDQIVARVSARTAPDPNEADVARFKAGINNGKPTTALDTLKDTAIHGASFGLDNVVGPGMAALTQGAYRAVKTGDIGEIGRTYSNAREAGQQYLADEKDQHPISGIAGQIAGLFANPVGAETGAGALVSKAGQYIPAVERAAQAVKASKVGKAIATAGNSAAGLGARAGAIQGGITGLSDTGDVSDALNEAGMGAIGGGVVGGAVGGLAAGAKLIRSHSAAGATGAAYDKIASLLRRSEDPTTGVPFTPQTALHEIKATDANGGDAKFGDLTPEGQGWMSYLAKQPGLKSASHLVNTATERMEGAADRFDAKVRDHFGIGTGDPDAHQLGKAITADRKAVGQATYTPEVMDRQLAWNDDLDKLFHNPAVKDALPAAQKLMEIDGKDPKQLAFPTGPHPNNGTMQHVPSMGTMQYVMQGLNSVIGKAVRDGDANLARAYSGVNRQLKDAVKAVNPEFAHANALQRDAFERTNSLELGTDFIKQMKANPRELLDKIKSSTKLDDIKVGVADALMHMRMSGNGDPVQAMRSIMRHADQHAVLTHVMGSNKALNEFAMFMRRETRAMRTDKLVSSGRQMAANLLKDPSAGGASEMFTDLAKSGGTGMAFGGPIGAASRIARSVGAWDKTMSGAAKEELGRILGGKGEDVAKGVARSAAYKRIAERRAKRAAAKFGKVVPAGTLGGYSNTGD